MASDWEFSKTTGRCTATGREFAEGESYFAVLFESPKGFERRDYADDAWTGPPADSFCYWRGRVPVHEKRHAPVCVDHTVLTHIFLSLEDEESETKQQFRCLLALLLMRKRLLKLERTIQGAEGEYWQMRLLSDQSIHQVLNPRLTAEEADRLGVQLKAILSGDVEAVESLDQPDLQQEAPVPEGENRPAVEPEAQQRGDGETK